MKRLQFEIPDVRAEEIDALVEKTGLKTRAQLFNAAMTLFEWAVRERESGRIIAAMNEGTGKYKEVDMPGLPVVYPSEDEVSTEDLINSFWFRIKTAEQAEAYANFLETLEAYPQAIGVLVDKLDESVLNPEETKRMQAVRERLRAISHNVSSTSDQKR